MDLPTELLRTFVEVIDAGSMLQASERVFLTPSAVSLQIKRLEHIVRVPLFYRDHRNLTLTTAGEVLEGYARDILKLTDDALHLLAGEQATGPIRIGMVEDFAQTMLVGTLRRFIELNPDVQLEIKVCGTKQLRDLIAANRLDIALCISVPSERETVATRSVYWFGQDALAKRDVIPLAILDKPCLFSTQAIASLEEARQPYEVVVETASVSALQAAVSAGLGITSRTAGFMATHPHLRVNSLPSLPQMGYAMLQSQKASKTMTAFRNILRASLDSL